MHVLAGLWVTRLAIGGYAGPLAYPPLRVCISAGTREAPRTRVHSCFAALQLMYSDRTPDARARPDRSCGSVSHQPESERSSHVTGRTSPNRLRSVQITARAPDRNKAQTLYLMSGAGVGPNIYRIVGADHTCFTHQKGIRDARARRNTCSASNPRCGGGACYSGHSPLLQHSHYPYGRSPPRYDFFHGRSR